MKTTLAALFGSILGLLVILVVLVLSIFSSVAISIGVVFASNWLLGVINESWRFVEWIG